MVWVVIERFLSMVSKRYCVVSFICLLFAAGCLTVLSTEVRAEGEFTPVYHPTMDISRMTGDIKIDGKLEDSGWRTAGHADNFAEHKPGDQTKPPVETEAFITYDSDKLYVAMICYDDPETIRASFCERDRGISNDDNICLLIDTYADAAWAYEFNVNPYGIQADLLWSASGGEDSGYDMIWESAGMVTDSGYQIELAIPFSSLRFPNKAEQVWKVDFWRNHPREVRRQYSWAAYDRSDPCWPCQWGTITGIKDVQPGRGIEILPTFVGYQSGQLEGDGTPLSPYAFDNDDPDGEFSLGGKYSITSNIVAEASYNPDFSQIEADAPQIDVNSNFALSFRERRPFFQEGSDLFRTIFDAVYTRSINDPLFTGKVTARLDRTSVAYMVARDENTPVIVPFEECSKWVDGGKSVSNILRARRTFGEDSRLGVLFTDRRLDDGGSGTLFSLDGNIRLNKQFRLEFQTMGTRTAESDHSTLSDQINLVDTLVADSLVDDPTIPDSEKYDTLKFDDGTKTMRLDGETFWGHAVYAGISHETANSYFDVSYLEKSPTYRADNGYQPSNNRRSIRGFSMYHFRMDHGPFVRLTPELQVGIEWNFHGDKKDEFVHFSLEGAMRFAQSSFHGRLTRQRKMYHGLQFDNLWVAHMCAHSQPSGRIALGSHINYGNSIAYSDETTARETSTGIWVDFKLMDRLLLETSFNYLEGNDLDTDERLYEGTTFWTRLNYQITRELSLRVVGQYDDGDKRWDIAPLLTYRLNPFSIFYVGTTIDYHDFDEFDNEENHLRTSSRLGSRQFFMKLQYLFQL